MENNQIDSIVSTILQELKKSGIDVPGSAVVSPQAGGPSETAANIKRNVSSDKFKVAVLGAGHGGLATAGHIALRGFPVSIYSPFEKELEPIRNTGGIRLEGDVEGFVKLCSEQIYSLSTSLDQAIRGVDCVLIIMPALAHKTIASLIGPALRDGLVVILSPGRTGGALEFAANLKRFANTKQILLGEAQTFLYAVESLGPAHVNVMKVKHKVWVAGLPATNTNAILSVANKFYPEYVPMTNVLETSLNNHGMVVHPAPMLLNTGLLDLVAQGQKLGYYRDIISPTVCNLVMEKIDAEKCAIVKAYGLVPITAKDWYRECYGIMGNTLYEVLQNNHYYAGFSAPKHFLGYYHVLDEVPNSLVPHEAFADVVGVETPMISAIMELANAMCIIDFRNEGRTLDKLGFPKLERNAMLDFVNNVG